MKLSVVIITHNEEANIGRTLESVQPLVAGGAGEIIVVDSGSTDRTRNIAASMGARVFEEPWKGYATQKNSAIEKAQGDWVLSLDADESVPEDLAGEIRAAAQNSSGPEGYWIPRKNYFLGRWMRHGGFYPDRKLRLFRRGKGRFKERLVHETLEVNGRTAVLQNALEHQAYPTLTGYLGAMNHYSSLGADIAVADGRDSFSFLHIVIRPLATFLYAYVFRLGFLDGREGLLLHLYHAGYVSWKYAKAWEKSRGQEQGAGGRL